MILEAPHEPFERSSGDSVDLADDSSDESSIAEGRRDDETISSSYSVFSSPGLQSSVRAETAPRIEFYGRRYRETKVPLINSHSETCCSKAYHWLCCLTAAAVVRARDSETEGMAKGVYSEVDDRPNYSPRHRTDDYFRCSALRTACSGPGVWVRRMQAHFAELM